MSVVESKREIGKLHVYTLADKYLTYVINSTRNCFQKDLAELTDPDAIEKANIRNENGKWYAEQLRLYAVELLAEIDEANETDGIEEYTERLFHQRRAIILIRKSKVILQRLYEEHIIKAKKYKSWLGEIKKVKDPLYRWKRSDAKRFNG